MRQGVILAFDIVNIPYYGKFTTDCITGGKAERGTAYFTQFFTLNSVVCGFRLLLALLPLQKGDLRQLDVLVLKEILGVGITVMTLHADDPLLLKTFLEDKYSAVFLAGIVTGAIVETLSDNGRKLQQEIKKRLKSEALVHKQKEELNLLVHAIKHDLRNFFNIINVYGAMLGQKSGIDKETKINIGKKIQMNIQRADQLLIKSIQVAAAGLVADLQDNVNLEQIITRPMDTVLLNDIQFIHDPLPIVRGDFAKLYEVFKNLLENAKVHGYTTDIKIQVK